MRKNRIYYCKTCAAPMPCSGHGPNHILHIILSIVTGGLWLLPYALVGIESSWHRFKCQRCGGKV